MPEEEVAAAAAVALSRNTWRLLFQNLSLDSSSSSYTHLWQLQRCKLYTLIQLWELNQPISVSIGRIYSESDHVSQFEDTQMSKFIRAYEKLMKDWSFSRRETWKFGGLVEPGGIQETKRYGFSRWREWVKCHHQSVFSNKSNLFPERTSINSVREREMIRRISWISGSRIAIWMVHDIFSIYLLSCF